MKREFFEETGTILDDTVIPKLHHVEIEQYDNEGIFSAVVNIYYVLHFDKTFDVILENGVYSEYMWCSREEFLSKETHIHLNKDVVEKFLKS